MTESICLRSARSLVLVDGPNVDGVLGQCILGRKPRPYERPRWDRVRRACIEWFCASECQFVLNPNRFAEHPDGVSGFFRFLHAEGWQVPAATAFQPFLGCSDLVDAFIANRIDESIPEVLSGRLTQVVLVSHDHGYAPSLQRVLDAGGGIVVVGFREWLHPHLVNIESNLAVLFDLEYDLEAFDVRLPRAYRPTSRSDHGIADFN